MRRMGAEPMPVWRNSVGRLSFVRCVEARVDDGNQVRAMIIGCQAA